MRLCAIVLSGFLLAGCLPSGQGQSDEEKEPHYLSGKSRVSAMDYGGAIESFLKAVEVNPRSGAAHLELGWLYDQKASDPAAAIYHYSRYLQLRPSAHNADTIRNRILFCKQELARTVSLGPVTQAMQKEFEQLALTNKFLQEELEKWKAYAATLQAMTNRLTQVQSFESQSIERPPSASYTQPVRSADPSPASGRTHAVRAGETPTQIARRYGVSVNDLLKANPRLDPRRMQVGEVLRIP